MPVKPRSKPTSAPRERRSPSPRSASTPDIQKGEVASVTAASPLGTCCSAQFTKPLPNPIIISPWSASDPHRAGAGSRSPRTSAATARIVPATVHRMPPISAGGVASSATRMPRYVVPQMTQTAIQATYAERGG